MAAVVFALLFALVYSFYIISQIKAAFIKISRIGGGSRSVTPPPPPPKAKGAWPIIGHLHTKLTHTTLGTMADKYGPIFTVQLGSIQNVVVSSSEVAKELFTTHDLAVSSRPKLIASQHFGYNYAMFGLAPYTPYWREIRKLSTVHLLSNAKLEQLKHIRVFEVEESIKELYKMCVEDGSGGQIRVEMKQWVLDLIFNISVRMIAGKRYYYGSGEKSREAERCQATLKEFFEMLGNPLVADFLTFLRWFDLGGHEKSIKRTSREMDSIVQVWLDEHRMARKKIDEDQATDWVDRDFMDVLVTNLEGMHQLGEHDSNTIVKATCLNLIAGSSDTSTVSITWAIALLLKNRQSLDKAQEELDTQVGRQRMLTDSDIPNLPYLEAIIKETLRLYPPAPLAFPHEFTHDCILTGFHVNKGSRLILNIHKIHRDPQVWPDPLEFKPERFLTSHKHIDVRGRHFELIPFSAGRRMCPGVSMGLSFLYLALASLLHAFDFATPSNDHPVGIMQEGFGLTVTNANPLDVLLTPRLAAHLYL